MKYCFNLLIALILHSSIIAQEMDKLKMLSEFSTAWSSLRYFYPDNTYNSNDWDKALCYGVEMIMRTERKNFKDSLESYVQKIAPFATLQNKERKGHFRSSSKLNKRIYWQYVGFAERPHAIYKKRLVNANEYTEFAGWSLWLDEKPILNNCTVEISFFLSSRNHKKNYLEFQLEAFNYKSKKDSIYKFEFVPTKSWQKKTISIPFDQGKSYLTFLFGIQGYGSIAIRDLNIQINYQDSTFKESIVFNQSSVEAIPRSTIRAPYGYRYSIDKKENSLIIQRNKKENNSKLSKHVPRNRWASVRLNDSLWLSYPASISKKQFFKGPKQTIYETLLDIDDVTKNKFAALIKIYSVVDHFFPYKAEIQYQGIAYLEKYLAKVATLNNADSIYMIVKEMVAELRDGHAYVHNDLIFKERCLDADFKVFEDQLFVVGAAKEYPIKIGDIIWKVNGIQAMDLLKTKMTMRSGSDQYKLARESLIFSCSDTNYIDTYTVIRAGDTLNIQLSKYHYAGANLIAKSDPLFISKDSIMYVDLSRVTYTDFLTLLNQNPSNKGIIFDLREYPTILPEFLGHFSKTVLNSAYWQVPVNISGNTHIDTLERWAIQPKDPFIGNNHIFLIGPNTVSYGESLTEIIDHYNLGKTIGSSTAGVNGNKTSFSTPGGFIVYFTAMKVDRLNGNQLFNVGIPPNIHVKEQFNPTEDNLIQYAINVLLSDKK